MANEITITTALQAVNGNFRFPQIGSGSIKIDQAVAGGGSPGMITATFAAHVLVDLTDLATEGWCYMKNIDLQNFITFGVFVVTYFPLGKLKPGESALFRLDPGAVFAVQADTADSQVQIHVMED